MITAREAQAEMAVIILSFDKTMAEMYRSHTHNLKELMKPLNPEMGNRTRKQRALMIVPLTDCMMLFVGYGKKRPPGSGDIEREVVAHCTRIATDANPS